MPGHVDQHVYAPSACAEPVGSEPVGSERTEVAEAGPSAPETGPSTWDALIASPGSEADADTQDNERLRSSGLMCCASPSKVAAALGPWHWQLPARGRCAFAPARTPVQPVTCGVY